MKKLSEDSADRHPTFDEFEVLADQDFSMQFRDLAEVSDALMAGYARFVRQGMPCEMVGYAMLGATLNLYEIFGMQAGLPQLLRAAADKVELQNASPRVQAN